MTDWFKTTYRVDGQPLRVAHFTDCHLFADSAGRYFDVDTAAHLRTTLDDMAKADLDLAIFGGDLTQDHSEQSYRHFAELVAQSALTCPVFWLPGNHDDIAQLSGISHGQIRGEKSISAPNCHLLLLDSKGPTPAGLVSDEHFAELAAACRQSLAPIIAFCHHHPLAIEGYLDKHMLENGDRLLDVLAGSGSVSHLFHGHVHNDYGWRRNGIEIAATPATSIQFSKYSKDWQQENLGPGWRLIEVDEKGRVRTEVIWSVG